MKFEILKTDNVDVEIAVGSIFDPHENQILKKLITNYGRLRWDLNSSAILHSNWVGEEAPKEEDARK